MNNFVKILEKMKYLQECKKVLPFETLGRSLAYNCYTPRLNFADLQILKSYQKVTINLNDIENLLQNSTNIESNVFDFLESNNLDSNNISKNENKVIIFLQDSNNADSIESNHTNSQDFLESKNLDSAKFIESSKKDSVNFIESNPNKNPINIIDSISMLRRLTPYFITFDSIIIDSYQVLEIAIAGADMFIFDYRIFSEFCKILLYLDSKNISLDSINLSDFTTHNFIENSKQDFNQNFQQDFNQHFKHDFIQKIKNFSKNNKLEIANLTSNLASEILNLANNLALIPIFKIHSQSDIESISQIYNIECIICDKKLGNLELYINFYKGELK